MNQSQCQNDEYAKKMQEYYWKCFFSEFSKICIFLIIFIYLNLVPEYLVSLFFLLLVRKFGGGLHFQHYTSCLIISFSFIFGSIFLAEHVMLSPKALYITCLLCLIGGYHLVPVTSSNRPPATIEQIHKSKRNTGIIITAFSIIICIYPNSFYLLIGYWTIVLHIFQLVLSHISKEVKSHVRLGHQI